MSEYDDKTNYYYNLLGGDDETKMFIVMATTLDEQEVQVPNLFGESDEGLEFYVETDDEFHVINTSKEIWAELTELHGSEEAAYEALSTSILDRSFGVIVESSEGTVMPIPDMDESLMEVPGYMAWVDMLLECYNPERDTFGESKVCERWIESFDKFWEDMGDSYEEGATFSLNNDTDSNINSPLLYHLLRQHMHPDMLTEENIMVMSDDLKENGDEIQHYLIPGMMEAIQTEIEALADETEADSLSTVLTWLSLRYISVIRTDEIKDCFNDGCVTHEDIIKGFIASIQTDDSIEFKETA